ncbi:hypothetical protein FCM35_KLT12717 [Carex littledalei]|uniref:Uncharacterized protein n=1 Tax=Carex littledalei TaxID=544730 RepID=A0A833QFH7_9POAL|nr:hypothetical protein FCM35_KLT12717 [Carex littledalei]
MLFSGAKPYAKATQVLKQSISAYAPSAPLSLASGAGLAVTAPDSDPLFTISISATILSLPFYRATCQIAAETVKEQLKEHSYVGTVTNLRQLNLLPVAVPNR